MTHENKILGWMCILYIQALLLPDKQILLYPNPCYLCCSAFRIDVGFFLKIVQDVRVYSEEVELDSRDAEQDYLQYKESCESLATLMNEIQDFKANGAKEGVRIIHIR